MTECGSIRMDICLDDATPEELKIAKCTLGKYNLTYVNILGAKYMITSKYQIRGSRIVTVVAERITE